ncbi:MAG TPA: ABC transporter ATP-binding protein [Candidatus Coproplasma avicola]|uniref:ABC transporter ATP-binding protein n=1 Tax=Candidatus Coproplasma avicola TaxID=2840744 RepID=A0A9D1E6Q2_9FIRM|nr:ABC transporter ATP-binding protein [Candidatus Coproplasma avicola]
MKFVGSIAELFLPLLLDYIIDDIVPLKDISMVLWLGLLMLVCSLAAMFGNIFANRLSVSAAAKMTHDLRYDLFKKISYLKSGQVDEVTVPSLVSRLTSDSYYVNQMVARTLRLGVRAPILLIGGMLMTFIVDVWLALVLLACVPFVIVAVVIITKKSIPYYAKKQACSDDMVRAMQENISGVRIIKALSAGEREKRKFGGVSDRLGNTDFSAKKVMSLTNPLATLILNLGLVVVIIVGALMSDGAGSVLAVLTYFTMILNGMLGLSKIFVVLSQGIASADRIEQVLEMDERQFVGQYPAGNADYMVEFKDVNFSYNGGENNLENINFTLRKGGTLGIIGATGSGKSTIVNLLMRFYDVSSGAVYVGGDDVRSVPVETLRSRFGVAFQNDFLMADSVRANIDYGRNLPEADILSAADSAQAGAFISELDGGLNYDLAQKAANLSGGQKQRLTIARALAGKPEILILDDSSSALDYETDAALRRALAGNYPSTTKIIIAQRVSSVRSADAILVLDDGRQIGLGTHEQLLRTCEEYALIYKAQMGENF